MSSVPTLSTLRRWPAMLAARLGHLRRLGPAAAGPQAWAAIALGPRCALVRLQTQAGQRPLLTHALAGDSSALRGWRRSGALAGASAVLVLDAADRQLLTIDRPPVPDEELQQAVRYPMAEALDAEPDDLLTMAVPLPRINDSQRPQLLAVAASLPAVQAQLALARAAGISLRHIDIADTALRGMAGLQGVGDDGCIALTVGEAGAGIGLLWQGQFCALRMLPLPARTPGQDSYYEEQLALQIQRTADQFERQATQLSVRRVVAALPGMDDVLAESIRAALPYAAQRFELQQALAGDAELLQFCAADELLCTLACVAAARLQGAYAVAQAAAVPAPAAVADIPTILDLPDAPTSSAPAGTGGRLDAARGLPWTVNPGRLPVRTSPVPTAPVPAAAPADAGRSPEVAQPVPADPQDELALTP